MNGSTLNQSDFNLKITRPCSLCWCWSLLLEWCEKKTLLAGWWLEAAAGVL